MVISGEHMKKMVKSNQLELDDGEMRLLGFRMLMLPVYTWTKLVEELYRKHGEDEAFQVLFEIGKKHDIPRRQFLDQALYTADVLGLGRFSLEKLNLESGEITFRIDNSPFKESFENSEILSGVEGSIDYLSLGMAHKVSERVLQGEVDSEETHCTFQGDPCCRLVARVKND